MTNSSPRSRIVLAALAAASITGASPAEAWESVEGFGRAQVVATDESDDVFAAGLYQSSSDPGQQIYDMRASRHAGANGALLWDTVILGNPMRTSSHDEVNALLVADASVLVGGQLRDADNQADRFAVVALDKTTGLVQWRYVQSVHPDYPPAATKDIIGRAYGLAVDANGDVLAVGTRRTLFNSFSSTDISEGMVVKLDGSTGGEIWRRSVFGTAQGEPFAHSRLMKVTVAADGDAIVGGSVKNTGEDDTTCVVARYDAADGSEVWREEIGAGVIGEVLIDPSGNLNVRCTQTLFELDITDASVIWQQFLPDLGMGAHEVALTTSGDLIVGGAHMVAPNDADAAAMRLSGGDGSKVWQTTIPGLTPDVAIEVSEDFISMALAGDTGVFLSMRTRSKSSAEDAQVHKIDAVSGAHLWTQTIGDKQPRREGLLGYTVNDLAVDSTGDVAFAGSKHAALYLTGKIDGDSGAFQRSVAARRFELKTNGVPSLRFDSKDPIIGPVVSGTSGDPTVHGATLTVRNPTTLETKSYALPAAKWRRLDSLTGRGKYRYEDDAEEFGPCKSASQQAGAISVRCSGLLLDFTLDEASQESLVAVMAFGSAETRYCALLDSSSIDRDATGSFRAKNAAASIDCPELP